MKCSLLCIAITGLWVACLPDARGQVERQIDSNGDWQIEWPDLGDGFLYRLGYRPHGSEEDFKWHDTNETYMIIDQDFDPCGRNEWRLAICIIRDGKVVVLYALTFHLVPPCPDGIPSANVIPNSLFSRSGFPLFS